MTTAEKPLPPIGPAAGHGVIPLVAGTYYDPEWNSLTEIRVNGGGLTANLAASCTAASMSFSTSQQGQLSLTFRDDERGTILSTGLIRARSTIDWRNQHLEVRGINVDPGEGGASITVKGRSRVIGVLSTKPHIGKGSWGTQDVHGWLTDRCREAGARAVLQAGLGNLLFTRTADDDTTWAMAQRAASAVGAWCWEQENTIVFGRPTWLSDPVRSMRWDFTYNDSGDYTAGLTGQPGYSWSGESDESESLSLSLASADADTIRPGHHVNIAGRGVGGAVGPWIVTQVDIPLTRTRPVTAACGRIKNPEPQQQAGA